MDTSLTRRRFGVDRKPRAERRKVSVPARLTWKDARGATRFASVVTRDVSDHGVFIECVTPVAIPLYRLVHLQIEREARTTADLPLALRDGRVLSAVYRVGPCRETTGTPEGYALRLLVEPGRTAQTALESAAACAIA